LVYTKFNAFSYIVTSSRFLEGPIALHGFVHFLSTTAPLLTKVVYACSISFWRYLIYIYCTWTCVA
jgi:hypothetical protein